MGKELVEETRKLLPLSSRREDTYIGGISMGGYGAIYNGLRYKETFSKIVSLSPAADFYRLMVREPAPGFSEEQFISYFGSREIYENSSFNLIKAFEDAKDGMVPELFLCCGTEDRGVYPAVRELEEALVRLGIHHVYRTEHGDHEFDFWQRMMDPAFSFLAGIPEGTKDRLLIPGD